jgi:hypothetical protein
MPMTRSGYIVELASSVKLSVDVLLARMTCGLDKLDQADEILLCLASKSSDDGLNDHVASS